MFRFRLQPAPRTDRLEVDVAVMLSEGAVARIAQGSQSRVRDAKGGGWDGLGGGVSRRRWDGAGFGFER